MTLVGRPELIEEPWFADHTGRLEHQDELDDAISGVDRRARRPTRSSGAFEEVEAAIAPISRSTTSSQDPQFLARETITEVDAPEARPAADAERHPPARRDAGQDPLARPRARLEQRGGPARRARPTPRSRSPSSSRWASSPTPRPTTRGAHERSAPDAPRLPRERRPRPAARRRRLRAPRPEGHLARRGPGRREHRPQLRGGLGVLEDRRRRAQRGPRRDPLRDGRPSTATSPPSRSTSTAAAPASGACSGCSTSSSIQITFFGAAVAFERNPEVAQWLREAGHEPCCHGWRWEEVLDALARGGARAHARGDPVDREDLRRAAARLVLPLRPVGQHARAARRGGRLRLRLRRLQRRPPLLHRGRRASATSSSPTASPTTTGATSCRRASRTRRRSSTSAGAASTTSGTRARRTRR